MFVRGGLWSATARIVSILFGVVDMLRDRYPVDVTDLRLVHGLEPEGRLRHGCDGASITSREAGI